MHNTAHQDIQTDSHIMRAIPKRWRPYALLMRLDRPIGSWLLLLPSLWSITLHAPFAHSPWQLTRIIMLFAIGAVIMRGAGCVINDLWDKDLDKHVQRTASRPLACGAITTKQALMSLGALLFIGLLILLQFNQATIILGLISLPFIIAYPLMKRITWWPQAFLGLTFNFGALMGASALTGQIITPQALWLYTSGIFWTLAYDTIYAHQDKEDDALIGIKSAALRLGRFSPVFIYICYALSWICALQAASNQAALHILPAAICALYICKTWIPNAPSSALIAFKHSRIYGLILLIGLALYIL